MSTTRKMLKAQNTQLREQLAATDNLSRKARIQHLHKLEKLVQEKNDRIAAMTTQLAHMQGQLDQANATIKTMQEEERAAQPA